MHLEKATTERGILFTITGSLSGMENSTIKLFEAASRAIDEKPLEIVLDLSQALYLDSLSIGLLVGILLKCREHRIDFRLLHVPPQIIAILEPTNLKKVFPELY
jgi:anti-anti-sigma factor